MQKHIILSSDGYDPNRLFNAMLVLHKLRGDVPLARLLEVPVLLLKKIRRLEMPVTPALLIRMEEISGWSTRNLRDLMGDRRGKFRFAQVRESGVDDLLSEIDEAAAAKKLW